MRNRKTQQSGTGFTLIETMIAIVVLAIGVLGLAAMLAGGIAYMNMSQDDFIAQQKAAEIVESIYTARNDNEDSWQQLCNVGSPLGNNCQFTVGASQLCDAGADGIVGTQDDNCALLDYIVLPGPDGKLGTADDVFMPLSNFTRTIAITAIPGNTSLRQITVTINYTSGRFTRQYVLTTNISQFS
jgi:prepilin-type N-terminal cleavage/methylation domain-containing protein